MDKTQAAAVVLYVDGASQPSRTVWWFCVLNDLPVEVKFISLFKREHSTPEFAAVNRMKRVPALVDGDFRLSESHSIMRYLAQKFPIADNWYPHSDLVKRTRVDEYLDWHHLGLRKPCMTKVFLTVFAPMLGINTSEEELQKLSPQVDAALSTMEHTWLKDDTEFLANNQVSIADLSAYEEIAQLSIVSFDLASYPKLRAWMSRLEALPKFAEVHAKWEQVQATYKK
eukprot:TRINITY_DN3156_c3_g1_i1.p1 TRINITY_DN3156_c3_g1~~TRINITY_DN3156_c3_g1_i1.p1  ORF type:complete len:227 (-),score=37.19 TRINITY_DN3156_c3_g1_i1:81-761(-)